LASAQGPQAITVSGAVKQTLTLTTADLARMPRATVTAKNGGIEVTYEAVWLHEVLQRAGVPSGTELRGEALSTCVLAEATDGYQVVFSVAELDPAFTGSQALLADKAGGKPLSGEQGSFRLVASSAW
jgi:hypothetical protein